MKKFLNVLRHVHLMVVFLVAGFVFLHLGLIMYAYYTPSFDIRQINKYSLYDINGDLMHFSGNYDSWVDLEDISNDLIDATIILEDQQFYNHMGFNYLRIGVVAVSNVINNSLSAGASTITQQYARNIFENFDKTWQRKIDEALLTFELETHFSKDEILEGYLNTINYGGVFGISDASMYYFNKKPSELTLGEATILAQIPKSPSNYSPLNNLTAAKGRQELLLNMMVNADVITKEDKTSALNEELVYVGKFEEFDSNTIMYYKDAVIKELKTIINVDEDFYRNGGLKIYTNFDPLAQRALEESMNEVLVDTNIQVSAVMSDPENGAVLGIIGGTDYNVTEFNRVTDSSRQVGSTMKTFLYYAALENGFTSSSTFLSAPTTFVFSDDNTYSPINFGEKYSEYPISLATALAYSDNIYAIKTHLFLGLDVLVDAAQRVGITSKLEEIPSLPLGTNEISILEMTAGYSAFANEGNKVTMHFIESVEDSDGNLLYEDKEEVINVLNKNVTYILNELLANSYNTAFIDYNYPTCINLYPVLTRKYAIKTGTTNTDIWAIGYNKDVIVSVWNGYDDNTSINSSEYNYAKDIWASAIELYLEDRPNSWYDMPSNVSGVLVNPITGELATDEDLNKTIMYYIKGTEPYLKEGNLEAVFNQDNNYIES